MKYYFASLLIVLGLSSIIVLSYQDTSLIKNYLGNLLYSISDIVNIFNDNQEGFSMQDEIEFLKESDNKTLEVDLDFFQKTKSTFINDKKSFVEADLSKMIISLYKEGDLKKEFPILSKGREGAWWETPVGIYKIEAKEENHFSSFGKVYQPWSMVFQGNFFIHGWPYYKDNTPVSSTYSGGCIRLSNKSAEELFNLVEVGTDLIVYEKDFSSDNFQYPEMLSASSIQDISASSYLARDLKNNFTFFEKNKDVIVPIASITKLMTAIVGVEYINLEKELLVTKSSIIPTSIPRLKIGDKVSFYDILHLILLESSNEASFVAANHLGRIRFTELMNKKTNSIGMFNTQFIDSAGIDENNLSNTEDLFQLAKYIYNNRKFIFDLSSEKIKNSAYEKTVFKDLSNFNGFEDLEEFIGGKVGKTNAAKETMVSVFELEINKEKRPIAIIVLGSDDNTKDVELILNEIKKEYCKNSVSGLDELNL